MARVKFDKYVILLYNAPMKERTSHSLSIECKRLLVLLAAKLGLSRAGIIELAVRKLAEAEQVNDYHVAGVLT